MKESTQGIRVINIENSEELWERFLKNEKGPFDSKAIKKSTITKMSELLFKDITEKQMKAFEEMVKNEFSWHKCVCIRNLSPIYIEKFCEKFGFNNIGRKEVVLQSDGKTILFSEDFKRYPESIQN